MPKRSRKQNEDINILAKSIVEQITKESSDKEPSEEKPKKNPNAVALGRLGGKKGGPARAKKLTPRKRVEIAIRAAQIRWKKTES